MTTVKKAIITILLAIFFSCLSVGIYLNYYYINNMPRNPQPELGRVNQLNVHGSIVYLTKKEDSQLNWLFTIMMCSGLSGAALYVISKPASKP